jgi:hypothetical protein
MKDRPADEIEATGQPGAAPQDPTTTIARGYGSAVWRYRSAGWLGVLPLRPGAKVPHLAGFTGYDGAWPTDQQIARWIDDGPADANLMLRVNHGLMGIDVDAYHGKTGDRTLKEAESRWGPLPSTYRSSARGQDDVSGTRVYRVPPGVLFRGRIVFAEMGVGDIEIVPACWRRADRLMQSTKAFVQGNAGGDDAARDEKEGRPGDYTETADQSFSPVLVSGLNRL